MERPNTRRGDHIFKIGLLFWMYRETRGPNVKWGEHISNRGAGHHCPTPLVTALLSPRIAHPQGCQIDTTRE